MLRPLMSRSRRITGFTLLEAMVTVALVGILVSLAVPSFGAQIARNHLRAAAERIAADIAEARFEASRAGLPMHVHFETGAQWCYTVSNTDPCACGQSSQACQVRHVMATDHQGVTLEHASDLHFSPTDGTAAAVAQIHLRSSHGEALRVVLTRLGRAKVCAPESRTLGYPAC